MSHLNDNSTRADLQNMSFLRGRNQTCFRTCEQKCNGYVYRAVSQRVKAGRAFHKLLFLGKKIKINEMGSYKFSKNLYLFSTFLCSSHGDNVITIKWQRKESPPQPFPNWGICFHWDRNKKNKQKNFTSRHFNQGRPLWASPWVGGITRLQDFFGGVRHIGDG